MNRQQEIAELKERLEKLEAEEIMAKWPKKGDVCWVAGTTGVIKLSIKGWEDELLLGDIFRTKKEAERHRQYLILRARAKKMVGNWVPNFGDAYIVLHESWGDWRTNVEVCSDYNLMGTWRFPDRTVAQQFLDSLTDDDKQLLREYW